MGEITPQIVRLGKIEKHPNADTLGITQVYGGYPVIVKLGDFKEGDLAAYIPVDYMVPTSYPDFKFLDSGKNRTHERIKAKKLRGVFSMGLLVHNPWPDEFNVTEGTDVTDIFKLQKYVPPAERETGPTPFNTHKKARLSETRAFEIKSLVGVATINIGQLFLTHNPLINVVVGAVTLAGTYALVKWNRWANKRPSYPMYDIDGLRKYSDVFQEGEIVWISEKVHGCNVSFCHNGRRFHVKSRTVFRADIANSPSIGDYKPERDVYWKVAKKYDLKNKLKDHPGIVLYGEVFGQVQDLTYGVSQEDEVDFVAFDAMYLDTRKYMDVGDFMEFCRKLDIPMVPTLYHGPFHLEEARAMAEGPSMMPKAKNIREGIVIKPIKEERDNRIGRKILKMAGEMYLTRKEKE